MSIFATIKGGRAAIPICFCMLATGATAFECRFTLECYETEACADADFALAVTGEVLGTEYGDFEITGQSSGDEILRFVSLGSSGSYLLTVSPQAARLSVQTGPEPVMINYIGTCDGAF